MPVTPSNETLYFWFIKDGRLGHETQLHGLADRLSALRTAEHTWLTPEQLSWRLRRRLHITHPPHAIISAGRKTHRALYLTARQYNARSVVLMRPSLPMKLFDLIIAPSHDGLKPSNRVFNTLGVINRMTPVPTQDKHENAACMLIGGPSKHYDWNDQDIIEQIKASLQRRPDLRWMLFDSPRTPNALRDYLKTLPPRVQYQDSRACPPDALRNALHCTPYCWITPDSVSMVYESLTASCATALFDLSPAKKSSRVVRGVDKLLADNQVLPWHAQLSMLPHELKRPTLWEADRAAHWLIEKIQHEH